MSTTVCSYVEIDVEGGPGLSSPVFVERQASSTCVSAELGARFFRLSPIKQALERASERVGQTFTRTAGACP